MQTIKKWCYNILYNFLFIGELQMATLTETLAFRIPVGIKDKINNLALASHRKKSDIMLAWITEKLELESWQIEETKKAISLADAGEIASDEEVLQMRNKWRV